MASLKSQIRSAGSAGQPVPIRYSGGLAKAAADFANASFAVAEEFDRQDDLAAAREGRREGQLVGVPDMEREDTIRGRAFNDAALETYVNKVDLSTRQKLTELSIKHAADPAGFATASEAYLQGIESEVQTTAPWMLPALRQQFDLSRATKAGEIGNRYQNIVTNDQLATANALIEQMGREHELEGSALFDPDPREASKYAGKLVQDWARINSILSGRKPDGTPRFKATDREKVRREFFDRAYRGAALGWIDTQPDKLKAWRQVQKGLPFAIEDIDAQGNKSVKTLDLREEMSRAEWTKVNNYAMAQWTAQSRALNTAEVRDRRRQTDLNIETDENLWDRYHNADVGAVDQNGNPVTMPSTAEIQSMKNMLSPDDYRFHLEVARGDKAAFFDEESAMRLEDLSASQADPKQELKDMVRNGEITTRQSADTYRRWLNNRDEVKSPLVRSQQTLNEMIEIFSKTGSRNEALQMVFIKQSFDEWWEDGITEKGVRRDPTEQEARLMIFGLMRSRLSSFKANVIEGAMLPQIVGRTVAIPPGDRSFGRGRERITMPGLVRDRDTGAVDYVESSKNYFKWFQVDPSAPTDALPQELKQILADLSRYREAMTNVDNQLRLMEDAARR